MAVKDKKKYPAEFEEYSTCCLAKNPIRGGTPAKENKQIDKLKLKIGFLKNSPFKEFIYSISDMFIFTNFFEGMRSPETASKGTLKISFLFKRLSRPVVVEVSVLSAPVYSVKDTSKFLFIK
jgi:hypothetical protein